MKLGDIEPQKTDLDELMSRLAALDHEDPASWSKKSIDDVIHYQRKVRAQRESGAKPKRGEAAAAPIDLKALGLGKPKATITRRV